MKLLYGLILLILFSCKQHGANLPLPQKSLTQSSNTRFLCKDRPEEGCIDHHTFPPDMPESSADSTGSSLSNDGASLSPITFDPKNPWYQRCAQEIDKRLIGKDPAVAKQFRDNTQHLTTSWTYGLNLTAVTHLRYGPRGVAVTPRHVLYTKHYGYHARVGDTIRFLTMDNRLIERKVSALKYVATDDPSDYKIDITVVRLDADLPGSISPMKLVKADNNAYRDMPVVFCPVLRIDQEAKALVVRAAPGTLEERNARFWQAWPDDRYPDDTMVSTYQNFYENMISGDSSSPSIAIYSDENGISTYLLSQVTSGGPGEGSRTANQAAAIQTIIHGFGDIDEKYQLRYGPHEHAGHAKPFCSVTAARVGNTGDCDVKVSGSGDKVTGVSTLSVPVKKPWLTVEGSFQTIASCPSNDQLSLSASLSGPGGTSLPCESNPVIPAIKPTCTLDVVRIGETNQCRASLKWNKDSGPVSSYDFGGKNYLWDGLSSNFSITGERNSGPDKLLADFNGDGLGDQAVRNAQSQWVVSLGQPSNSFSLPRVWGAWPVTKGPWLDVMAADFNGDKKFDVVGRSSVTGEWFVLFARPKAPAFRSVISGKLETAVTNVDVLTGDVDQDGFTDLMWRSTTNGDWWFKRGSVAGLSTQPLKFGNWSPHVRWVNTRFVDVDGDGRGELVGMTTAGRWWVSSINKNGSQLVMKHSRVSQWNESQVWNNLVCVKGETANFEANIIGPGGAEVCRSSLK